MHVMREGKGQTEANMANVVKVFMKVFITEANIVKVFVYIHVSQALKHSKWWCKQIQRS